ncbi:MAG TPA: winged helix-turn-helix domain-containing protein [Candidatus Sulfotelmatobacter sp.]|nr:winged helix-turn-helix domain-containing protein [Candidatus Sulfotelmatobacter sp.]
MGTSSTRQTSLRFGLFSVDLGTGQLYRHGHRVALQEKPFRILVMLLERPGDLVTRDDIRKQLWPDGTFVDFNEGIDTALKKLRHALGDSAQNPIFVETIPRRGYRFIAPVTPAASNPPPPPEVEVVPRPRDTIASVPRSLHKYLFAVLTVGLIIAVAYQLYRPRLHARDLDLRQVQITKLTDNGQVQAVAISPDGRYLAYARGDEIRQSLWLQEVTARSDHQILPDGPGFHGLTFSPDGTSLYVVRSDARDPAFKYLYVLPAHGGAVSKLITDVDSPVSFSPDGKQFVYERCVPPRKYIEVKIANANGSNDHVLTLIQDGSAMLYQPGPNWSPDGQNIAIPVVLANHQLRWVIDLVSAKDGSIREIFSSPRFLGRPVWLPGGKTLLFPYVDNAALRYQLWTISFPEGRAQPLTHDLADYGSDLDMTRDGHTFATSSINLVTQPWIAPASDLSQARQVPSDAFPIRTIAEAADGKLVITNAENIAWLMYTDGSQRTRFTDVQPAFEPATCGQFVLFRVDNEDTRLERIDQDGSHTTLLAHGEIDSPACSADHTAIFYYTEDPPQKIWKVPLQGGSPQKVADALGDLLAQTIDASPDGQFLVYPYTQFGRVPSEGWKLAVIPVNGGPPVKQFPVPSEAGGVKVRWSSNGKGLQYVVTENGVSNIWEQPLSGGKPKPLTRFTSGQIFYFTWTLDRTRMLMARGSENRDAVLLRDLQLR